MPSVSAAVDRTLRAGVRRGFRRGVGEGSRTWLAVGAVALALRALRALRALLRRTPGPVVRETLAPGQTLTISHLPERR